MAKISDGYTIGSVVKCIKEVITVKRNLRLRVQPLTHLELINALSTKDPIYREEEEAFLSWWSKTPLGRRKQRALEMEAEAKLETDNSSDKKGSKKKWFIKVSWFVCNRRYKMYFLSFSFIFFRVHSFQDV